MQSYVIHLIRHGAIDETLRGRYIGKTDARLSPRGRQALEEIRSKQGFPSVQRVYSSPLSRCTESCGLLFRNRIYRQ